MASNRCAPEGKEERIATNSEQISGQGKQREHVNYQKSHAKPGARLFPQKWQITMSQAL